MNPYGFISKYQALQYKTYQTNHFVKDNIKTLALTISDLALRAEEYHQKAIHSLIHAFRASKSSSITNRIIENISTYINLTPDHLTELSEAIKNNKHIAKASKLAQFKQFLREVYSLDE